VASWERAEGNCPPSVKFWAVGNLSENFFVRKFLSNKKKQKLGLENINFEKIKGAKSTLLAWCTLLENCNFLSPPTVLTRDTTATEIDLMTAI